MYNSWAISLVTAQLGAGKPAGRGQGAIRRPDVQDQPLQVASVALPWSTIGAEQQGPRRHCPPLRGDRALAWEGAVQAEAAGKVNELFPNLSRDDYLPNERPRGAEDVEAGFMGLPFNEPESEHEWEGWFN